MSNFSQNTSKMRWIQYCTVDVYEFNYFEMVMQWEWVFEKYILVEISMQDPSWVWFLNLLRSLKITSSILSGHRGGNRLWENGFFDFKVEKIIPAYMRIYLCSPLPTDFCRFLLYCLMIPGPGLAGRRTEAYLQYLSQCLGLSHGYKVITFIKCLENGLAFKTSIYFLPN